MHPAAKYSVPQYPGTPRCTSQTSSSAFSACASPSEDWTKISDFGERRRIQSRIAQRNYRIKQKQRLERAKTPTLELTHEELATPGSTPGFSQIDSQQDGIQDFYDISTPDAPQQQFPPSSDDCATPVQQFTPQLSAAQSTSGSTPYLFHTSSQQQPTPSFYNASPQQQSARFSDDCGTPLQHFVPTPQPPCTHESTSVTTSYLFHTGSQQQPFHSGCAHKAPQQHCQPLSHDCVMFPQQCARPSIANSQPPCPCTPTSGSALYHPQRMHSLYDRAPPWASRAGPEDYTRAPYGQFEASWGAPAVDLNWAFAPAPLPSRSYMALPLPTERGCCCHHNHTHPPAIAHAVPMNGFDMPHPYQDARMLP